MVTHKSCEAGTDKLAKRTLTVSAFPPSHRPWLRIAVRELRWDFVPGLGLGHHDAYKSDSLTWKHTHNVNWYACRDETCGGTTKLLLDFGPFVMKIMSMIMKFPCSFIDDSPFLTVTAFIIYEQSENHTPWKCRKRIIYVTLNINLVS